MQLLDLLKKNKSLRNIHKGKRCFIVGNGPSIKKQDLLLLANEVKIVVNSFSEHPNLEDLQPEYWMLADPDYWNLPKEWLFPIFSKLQEKGICTKVFLPTQAVPFFSKFLYGLNIEPYFFHYDYQATSFNDIDFTKPVPPLGQNVITTALMLAYHMGCSDIYLIGCDHTWWSWTEKGDYEGKINPHFYETNTPVSENFSFEELAKTVVRQRFEYDVLKKYFDSVGTRVFNATEGGYLDMFPRIKYEDLFSNNDLPISSKHTDNTGSNHSFSSVQFLGQSFADNDCSFGGYNTVHPGAKLYKSNIGRYTYIGPDAKVHLSNIGSFCSIGTEVQIGVGRHPTKGFISTYPAFFSVNNSGCLASFVNEQKYEECLPVNIGHDVWIGNRAIICDGIKIGDGAIIAAGAVVAADVEPYSIVGGVPAKLIRKRYQPDEIAQLLNFKWWEKDINWISKHAGLFSKESDFFKLVAEEPKG